MKKFERRPTCCKCGGDDIAVKYVETHIIKCSEFDCDVLSEHLHRTCRACGYGWTEETKDAHDG